MPGIDYHQLRQQVSMPQVLGLIGFQATRRRGPQLRGPCPIPGCRSTLLVPFQTKRGILLIFLFWGAGN